MRKLQKELEALREQGMLRTLKTVAGPQGPRVIVDGREVLLLCSNNYLGLAGHPALIEASCDATSRFGVGSGASRLVSGTMELHEQLEARIADFKGTEGALVFNSGYAANTGILQGLAGPGDLIFSDALNHASIIDGCRLSGARVVVYPHRDMAALEELLQAEASRRHGRWLIVSDGVFSMDGDLAPLPELVALKERYEALLMVDDAHGGGVLGASGRGSAERFGCLDRIDLHMGTLGKAFGCFGAYLAARREVIDTLINRSRSFIFSTSLPPGVLGAALAAFDIVDSAEGAARRAALENNRQIFVEGLRRGGLDLGESVTQIVPIVTGEPQPTMEAARRLLDRGIFLQGIRPPTVPVGQCRLRATLMADHRPEEVAAAAEMIVRILAELPR
ncbi:8-amino-7-oxononanoate synthase [Trichloromonas acetexigens]|uniref:8-amino-7-oxononanoate synthase n=1 Tax=Trichloromonas acetexigens TaxID=38815 RepID=A0A550J882_9BACT|nr:8-amino-7-oxononanoate synthase [Desulfuromonas acetexigens]TRO79455.1 8-amino-7-oxononanoate synthase [Desulfuromonas acetexigens]